MSSRVPFELTDEYLRGQMEYWRQVRESGGFDLEGISVPQGTTGLMPYDCEREDVRYPDPVLVERYARFGLHRYNICHGTNLQFHHLKKFNVTMICQATYYITLAASDPATTSLVTLHLGVAEGCRDACSLNLTCFIAKLEDTPIEPCQLPDTEELVDDAQLPSWPSDFNDCQRFYQVKESELQDNGWIRLYLELALCTNDRELEDSDLSRLQIVKVAIEGIQGNEKLQAVAANVYIMFKGLAMASIGELGEHVVRKVIVRRAFNEPAGCMTLLGGYGLSIGEVAEERDTSRPNFIDLFKAGKFIPYRGPMTGPPLGGILGRKAIEAGLFRDYGQD
ncbi:Protein MS5 [Arabidopsis thaliana x Arabidopsis arenosa]|uniref:Protein MS5 n=1 Tax=Arabidopsis thaliana x Arabidopsis arenosa TaxID=1240361 RepID=A0A8T1XWQ4_9BRAS|nr:Protein MS5 [Arabidopsis thaliana x Arabidopsis arenosa]